MNPSLLVLSTAPAFYQEKNITESESVLWVLSISVSYKLRRPPSWYLILLKLLEKGGITEERYGNDVNHLEWDWRLTVWLCRWSLQELVQLIQQLFRLFSQDVRVALVCTSWSSSVIRPHSGLLTWFLSKLYASSRADGVSIHRIWYPCLIVNPYKRGK